MTPMHTPQEEKPLKTESHHGLDSVADELQRERERLRRLAEELKAREEAQAELREQYECFKQATYTLLREKFERELGPLPDKDLETLAAEEGAQPLEAFIGELERIDEGQ